MDDNAEKVALASCIAKWPKVLATSTLPTKSRND